MKPTTKRIIIRTAIATASVVATALLAIGITINVVATPEKLTPIVLKYAGDYLNADVELESVEATFFSSFPRFGVKINNGTIVSKAIHSDSASYCNMDTLVVFKELRIGINLSHYIFDNEICIGRLRLKEPQIRLFTNEQGMSNWDILRSASSDSIPDDTTHSESTIFLHHITVEDATINYSDRTSKTYAYFADVNLSATGDMNLHSLDMDLDVDDRLTHVAINGTKYLNGIALGIDGHIEYDSETDKYLLYETYVGIDGNSLYLDGWIEPDSVGVYVDMQYGVRSPSVEGLFAQIPKEYISAQIDVEKGSANFTGSVRGRFADDEIPVIECNAQIDRVKARYEGMKQDIEDLTAIFTARIDRQQPDSSYVRIEKLHFLGGDSEFDARLDIDNLIDDAHITGNLKTDMRLSSLMDVLPLDNTSMKGNVNADLLIDLRLSHLLKSDYGRIRLTGKINVDSLNVVNDTTGFQLRNDARLVFRGRDTLRVDVDMNRLVLRNKSIRLRLTDFHAKTKTFVDKDTSAIATLICHATANRFMLRTDTLRFFGKRIVSDNELRPTNADKRKPYLNVGLKCDSLLSSIYGTRSITEKLNTTFTLEKTGDTTWYSNGNLLIDRLNVGIPRYALPVSASNIHLTQGEREIKIHSCDVSVGQSDVKLQGSVHNLYYAITTGIPLNATINMEADTLNFNELLSAIVEETDKKVSVMSTLNDSTMIVNRPADEIATDSMPSQIFAIPDMLNFTIGAKARHIVWSKLAFNKVRGHARVCNGALHLTDLFFQQSKSRAITIMSYKVREKRDIADINCFVRWEKADIGEIVSSLNIDSLVPMMKPLKGEVDCYFAAKMQMDSTLNVDLNTLKASMHIGAKRLTLLDTETFAKIAKTLMFKNKKENYIDTLACNILVDTGYVKILPCVVKMDRYRAVVGGDQDVDLTRLNYHISIIKSPLPFKAGVNIVGKPDDIDIDITTAKLKKHADDATQANNDTISLEIRKEILRDSYRMSGLPIPNRLK